MKNFLSFEYTRISPEDECTNHFIRETLSFAGKPNQLFEKPHTPEKQYTLVMPVISYLRTETFNKLTAFFL